MDHHFYLYLITAIVVIGFLVEQTLEYLNLRHMKTELPEQLKDIYPQEEYRRSISYQKERQKFSFLLSILGFLLLLALLLSGAFGWLDSWIRSYVSQPVLVALVFFGILFIASDLLSLPFQWYSTFVIEEKWGFNKTTPKLFLADKLKGYLLTVVIGGGILVLLIWLILYIGPDFWIYFWLVMVAFLMIVNMLYASLIIPLFNKLTPLGRGELKEKIEEYSNKVNFPIKNIYVIDGSKRSSKANAFFSGLGKEKKIVLYDTLIEKHTSEELVAVLAHEAGHYKKKHIFWGFGLSVFQIGVMLFLLSLLVFSEDLSMALGAESRALHLNLLAFGLLYSPVSMLMGLGMNLLSRKNEYEADAYAAETYSARRLQDALKKLSVDNLSNLFPHPLYVMMHYSHPPLLKRLEALDKKISP